MGRTDSDFNILDTTDLSEAVRFLANLKFLEQTAEMEGAYGSREYYVYVNGFGEETDIEEFSLDNGELEATLKEPIKLLKNAAQTELDRLLLEHKRKQDLAEAERKYQEALRQREADLRKIAELKKKHGIE